MRDRNAEGKVEVLKVWEREEQLGSLPDRLFASGEFSKPIMEKLSSFFGKFKGSYHSAHREVEKAAASASKSKESDKT